MRKSNQAILMWVGLLLVQIGWGSTHAWAQKSGVDAGIKISQFNKAEFCDMAIDADGTLHAVFTEFPEHGKPRYLYHRASSDGGKTWSEPKNLSDDESGNSASFTRLIVDAKGRLFCVLKYVAKDELLDGPGGNATGYLVYRAMEGGAWSKRIAIPESKMPCFSWFVALDPAGAAHVIWSQMAKDALTVQRPYSWYADYVRDAVLDGAALGPVRDLITPRPVLTPDQQKEIRAAGKSPKYEDTQPEKLGLIDLRGYIDPQGAVHFIGEDPGIQDGPSNQQTGRRIIYFNGQKTSTIYTYEKYKTYNTFNDPPALLLDAAGKEHVIRTPEPDKAEKTTLRDYDLAGGELGDFVDIITPDSAKGKVTRWQAHGMPGGRMVVTASLTQKGGYQPDDTELYFSSSQGGGKWSQPKQVTGNASAQDGSYKRTSKATGVGVLYNNSPRQAAIVQAKQGGVSLLIVNNRNTIVGVTSAAVGGARGVESSLSTISVDEPAVYFVTIPADK